MEQKLFKRGNGETVTFAELIQIVSDYIASQPQAEYEITIGTDSQNHSRTKIVEALAVHRVGDGGIFFYYVEYIDRIRTVKEKIIEETSRSLQNAEGFLDEVQLNLLDRGIDIDNLNLHFQIHCDIGHQGKTKLLIKEIVNWVHSLGYECAIKPNSYTASGIADRISK